MTQHTPKKRRRSDGIATRKRISEHATRLFASQGYNATSLRSIASATKIDIATLKYHFKDKASLFGFVYAQGYERFAMSLLPTLQALEASTCRSEVRDAIVIFSESMHQFVSEDLDFVRLTLFRMLEDQDEVIEEEENLQMLAIKMMEEKFQGLVDRKIILSIDARALVVFLISSFCMWNVTARIKGSWLGDPHIDTEQGQMRSDHFYKTILGRILGLDEQDA